MKKKQWDDFLNHLDLIERRTKRVLRHRDDWEWRHYPDYDLRDFREEIDERLQAEKMNEVLLTLTDRERKILIYRFGLIDNRPLTLEQVGELINVNKQRIRQIECRAIRKMRHPKRKKNLFCPLEWKEREKIRVEEERKQAEADKAEKQRKKEEYQKWYDNGGREELQLREDAEAERLWKNQERQRMLRQVEYENMLARQKLEEQAIKENVRRPYVWDAIKRQKRYLKRDGTYE